MMNRSRFESFIGFSEPPAQFRPGNLPFADAAVPESICEGQVFVKGWVAQGRDGGGLVQRLERDAPLLALLTRPDGTRLVPLRDHTAKRLGGIRRRNPTGEFSPFRRKNVLQPVEEEFLERTEVRPVLQSRAVEQVATLSTPHGSMHLRRAHDQLRGKLGVRRTIRLGCHDLEGDVHVLRLQHQDLHSTFANRESRIANAAFVRSAGKQVDRLEGRRQLQVSRPCPLTIYAGPVRVVRLRYPRTLTGRNTDHRWRLIGFYLDAKFVSGGAPANRAILKAKLKDLLSLKSANSLGKPWAGMHAVGIIRKLKDEGQWLRGRVQVKNAVRLPQLGRTSAKKRAVLEAPPTRLPGPAWPC